MNQKRSDRQKNGRNKAAHRSLAHNFIGQKAVGNLILTPVSPQPAIRFEYGIESRNYLRFVRFRSQRKHNVIERALHVEGRSQRVPAHPKDPEALVVGKRFHAADFVHVLRRERDSHNVQRFPPSVDHRADHIAHAQPVGHCERFADQRLIAASRFDVAALADRNVVQDGNPALGNRD